MIYPGDTYSFLCNVAADGVVPTVTTAPLITVFNIATRAPVVTSQAMPAVAGTQGLYGYTWSIPTTIPNGDYAAIVSYATSALTVLNQFLSRLRLGDSNINAVVAKDSTVAKD